jgi:hypothetical protein
MLYWKTRQVRCERTGTTVNKLKKISGTTAAVCSYRRTHDNSLLSHRSCLLSFLYSTYNLNCQCTVLVVPIIWTSFRWYLKHIRRISTFWANALRLELLRYIDDSKRRAFARNVEFPLNFSGSCIPTNESLFLQYNCTYTGTDCSRPRTNEQGFLDKFHLLVCTGALLQSKSCQILNKENFRVYGRQGELEKCAWNTQDKCLTAFRLHEQRNLWRKICCTHEKVKENMLVCMGINCRANLN